jgi:hypothetical protein
MPESGTDENGNSSPKLWRIEQAARLNELNRSISARHDLSPDQLGEYLELRAERARIELYFKILERAFMEKTGEAVLYRLPPDDPNVLAAQKDMRIARSKVDLATQAADRHENLRAAAKRYFDTSLSQRRIGQREFQTRAADVSGRIDTVSALIDNLTEPAAVPVNDVLMGFDTALERFESETGIRLNEVRSIDPREQAEVDAMQERLARELTDFRVTFPQTPAPWTAAEARELFELEHLISRRDLASDRILRYFALKERQAVVFDDLEAIKETINGAKRDDFSDELPVNDPIAVRAQQDMDVVRSKSIAATQVFRFHQHLHDAVQEYYRKPPDERTIQRHEFRIPAVAVSAAIDNYAQHAASPGTRDEIAARVRLAQTLYDFIEKTNSLLPADIVAFTTNNRSLTVPQRGPEQQTLPHDDPDERVRQDALREAQQARQEMYGSAGSVSFNPSQQPQAGPGDPAPSATWPDEKAVRLDQLTRHKLGAVGPTASTGALREWVELFDLRVERGIHDLARISRSHVETEEAFSAELKKPSFDQETWNAQLGKVLLRREIGELVLEVDRALEEATRSAFLNSQSQRYTGEPELREVLATLENLPVLAEKADVPAVSKAKLGLFKALGGFEAVTNIPLNESTAGYLERMIGVPNTRTQWFWNERVLESFRESHDLWAEKHRAYLNTRRKEVAIWKSLQSPNVNRGQRRTRVEVGAGEKAYENAEADRVKAEHDWFDAEIKFRKEQLALLQPGKIANLPIAEESRAELESFIPHRAWLEARIEKFTRQKHDLPPSRRHQPPLLWQRAPVPSGDEIRAQEAQRMGAIGQPRPGRSAGEKTRLAQQSQIQPGGQKQPARLNGDNLPAAGIPGEKVGPRPPPGDTSDAEQTTSRTNTGNGENSARESARAGRPSRLAAMGHWANAGLGPAMVVYDALSTDSQDQQALVSRNEGVGLAVSSAAVPTTAHLLRRMAGGVSTHLVATVLGRGAQAATQAGIGAVLVRSLLTAAAASHAEYADLKARTSEARRLAAEGKVSQDEVTRLQRETDRAAFRTSFTSVSLGLVSASTAINAGRSLRGRVATGVLDLIVIGAALGSGAIGKRGQEFIGSGLRSTVDAVDTASGGVTQTWQRIPSQYRERTENFGGKAWNVTTDAVGLAGEGVDRIGEKVWDVAVWAAQKAWDKAGYFPETRERVRSTATGAWDTVTGSLSSGRDKLVEYAFGPDTTETTDKLAISVPANPTSNSEREKRAPLTQDSTVGEARSATLAGEAANKLSRSQPGELKVSV